MTKEQKERIEYGICRIIETINSWNISHVYNYFDVHRLENPELAKMDDTQMQRALEDAALELGALNDDIAIEIDKMKQALKDLESLQELMDRLIVMCK